MRIGVSGWRLGGPRLGVGRYLEYIVLHWRDLLERDDRVTLFVSRPLTGKLRSLPDRFQTKVIRPRLTNALWENLLLPRRCDDIDVLFGPSYTLPICYKGKSVVTIHSVDEAQRNAHNLWHRLTYEQKYRLSAKRADRVITNAKATRERLHSRYGVDKSKVDVIWLGVDEAFHRVVDDDVLRATRIKYVGADRPYILFVGGFSFRRNVPMLMTAFSGLKKNAGIPHSLLLMGPNRANIPLERLARELQISDSVIHQDVEFSDHREIAAVYKAAEVFVLPSSSEGFSLTLAEAMTCGVPAITVNCDGLGEIGNGFAYMMDEPSVDGLQNALKQILGDSQLREQLRAKSLERSKDFRWEVTARRTLDVLRQVADS